MTFATRSIRNEDNIESGHSVATYEHEDKHFKSTAYSTSSVVTSIHRLHTDLNAQYQHDKEELTDLNQRLHLFVSHLQKLETKNSKYIAQLADFRLQFSGLSYTDAQQWNERYLFLQSDLITISDAKVDYQFDFELSQLQIGIYQLLVNVKDERYFKLEQELKQSASMLATLRASYAELERETKSLYVAREDKFKQCLKLAHDWCSITKQRKKWELNVQILKSQVACYQNLRSYSAQKSDLVIVESVDATQFWSVELDKCVKKIRRDFELLYSTIYHQMTAYYETKTVEMQRDFEQTVYYQQLEMEEIRASRQTLQVEYEEVQKSWSYENKIRTELEATFSKLESEFKLIQYQQEEKFEAQSKEFYVAQESIMTMSYDIEEIRRSTKNLQVEIIVYRDLMEICAITEEVEIDITEKLVVENESRREGSIGIKECATSGRYISLLNHSTNAAVDISRWVVKRRVDSATEVQYTLPDGVRLQHGSELIIYSKLGADAARSSLNTRAISTLAHQELVSDNVVSWGMGSTAKTVLLNRNGEERASHKQWIVSGRNICDE